MKLCLCRCPNEELSDAIKQDAAPPFTQGKSVGRDEKAPYSDLNFHLLSSKYVFKPLVMVQMFLIVY